MRNKILSTTRDSIPYVKELRKLELVKSASTAILMQQLDYWFHKYPDGFYKFLQPCPNHPAYKKGDSWVEELAFSPDEFRTAFDAIGIRYTSKTTWREAVDCYNGAFYCSYHDKKEGITWYFRNHFIVDSALDILHLEDSSNSPTTQPRTRLLPVNGDRQSTVNGDRQSTVNGDRQSTVNGDRQSIEMGIPHLPLYIGSTEITTETTPPQTPPTTLEKMEGGVKQGKNSQRSNDSSRLGSGKKAKSLHKAKNLDLDTHTGAAAAVVAKCFEIEPGVPDPKFVQWRAQHYVSLGGRRAATAESDTKSEIYKNGGVRGENLWQDYQRTLGVQPGQSQIEQFSPVQMTDRQHKDWAQEYQSDREEFMAKPEFPVWWAYLEARPTFKEMIFRGINSNGTTAQQGQPARIQRKEAAAVPNRGGRGDSRGNSARSRGSDEQGSGSDRGGSLLRDLAQDCLQDLLEPL